MSVVEVGTSRVDAPESGGHLRARLIRDLRRLAAVTAAGAIGGFVVGGIGSRLAMMLIAAFNRDMTGRLTDDGAIMGRFDLAETAGLVFFTTILGIAGGLVFLAVRDLRLGPPWFRVASIIGGPAVVVGAMLVHRDGVDFTLLEPAALSIALFVAIPGLYAALATTLADRWLAAGSWFERAPVWSIVLLALPVLLFPPLALMTAVAWGVRQAILAWTPSRKLWAHPSRGWIARGALTAAFLLALHNLLTETAFLV